MTAQTIVQVLLSGLFMGLIYGLVAVGLSLIFGLMDVVNFAHGEFLMVAMYVMFGLVVVSGIDPLLMMPLVVGALFVLGALTYAGVIRHAMRARANVGMVQIFATFGLAITLRGIAQYALTPNYRSLPDSLLGGKTVSLAGIVMPMPQLAGALISLAAFGALYMLMTRTDLGRALEATREDAGAVALVGINKDREFMIGWGIGAALIGLAGSVLAIFYYIYPDVGAPFAVIAYITVVLGGFGSIFGALLAGVIVGLAEASTTLLAPPSMKSIGIYLLFLAVVVLRPRGLFGKF